MNKSLCALICFLVGVLVYSLIRSYCSCDVVEGYLGRNYNRLPEDDCRPTTESDINGMSMCQYLQSPDSFYCGGTRGSYVDICSSSITYDEIINSDPQQRCLLKGWFDNEKKTKCTTDNDKLKWLQWFASCPGVTEEPCSGERKPLPPGKLGKCKCSNGTAATGNNCPDDDNEVCDSCNSGYVLDGKVCVKVFPKPIINTYTCENKICKKDPNGELTSRDCISDCGQNSENYKLCCNGPGNSNEYFTDGDCTEECICVEGYEKDSNGNCNICTDGYTKYTDINNSNISVCLPENNMPSETQCTYPDCDPSICPACEYYQTCLPINGGIVCPPNDGTNYCGNSCSSDDHCVGGVGGCYECHPEEGKCVKPSPSPPPPPPAYCGMSCLSNNDCSETECKTCDNGTCKNENSVSCDGWSCPTGYSPSPGGMCPYNPDSCDNENCCIKDTPPPPPPPSPTCPADNTTGPNVTSIPPSPSPTCSSGKYCAIGNDLCNNATSDPKCCNPNHSCESGVPSATCQ